MTDLYGSPILKIEQQSTQLDFQISDVNDRLVACANQVAGPKPRKGLRAMLGSGLRNTRVVVQVNGLDGTPLFYVDHQTGAPVAIVGGDGGLVGRYDHQPTAERHQMGAAMLTGVAPEMKHHLVDAQGGTVGEVDWQLRARRDVHKQWHPVACDFLDENGRQVAHCELRPGAFKDAYRLQLNYQLPEPLRTLVIGSPLAYDLTRS